MHRLVPNFILERQQEGVHHGHFPAVTIFVDTSGFTPLTERLMDRGKAGAEVLGSTLMALFGPMQDSIYAHGGFIAGFAGDAFKAIFPLNGQDDDPVYLHALAAAQEVQQYIRDNARFETPVGAFEFAVKIVLADGEVSWSVWQAAAATANQRRAYSFRGEAILTSLQGEALAARGDLLLSEAVRQRLAQINAADLSTSLLGSSGFHRLDVPLVRAEMGRMGLPEVDDTDMEAAVGFYSRDLLTMAAQGEFRHVLTSFVNIAALPDPGAADDFMPRLLALLDQYGGYLCRVGQIEAAFTGGTFLLFWGAPDSYENDVTRALRFMLALQSELEVPLRAGLTYGLAYAGFTGSHRRAEYTCYGTNVILAARQMVAAEWGEIWLDSATARRTSERFDIVAKSGVQFKGFSEAQTIYQLRQQGESQQAYETRQLVGRQDERVKLEAALVPIFSGRFAGVVAVTGEPGIGKSHLVQAIQNGAWLTNRDANWFYCQTDEILRQPLNPIRYLLRHYFGLDRTDDDETNKAAFQAKMAVLLANIADEPLRAGVARTSSIVGALVGLHWEDSLYEQLSPELRFENSLDSIKRFLKAVSRHRPVILHIEDAHWLDDGTIQLLGHLTRNVADFPIAIVMTSREPIPPEWFADDTPMTVAALNAVPAADVAALAEQLIGESINAELAAFLHQKGEGNPFFIEQILLFLQEQGMLVASESGLGHQADQSIIPEDVRAILIARIDQLTRAVRDVVQTASVLGREFDVQVLSTMLQRDQELPTKMAAAEAEHIWSPLSALQYIFQHALLRDSAYDMQLGNRLKALHKVAGEAIEQIYGPNLANFAVDLSYHFEQAGEQSKAITYLDLAAQTAQAAYHNEEALAALDRLAHYLTDPAKIADTRIRQAEIAHHVGRLEEAQRFVEDGLRIVEAARLTRMWLQLLMLQGRIHDDQGQLDGAVGYYEQVLDLARRWGEIHHIGRAYVAIADIEHERKLTDRALANYERALPFVSEAGDRRLLSSLYNSMGSVYRTMGDYERTESYYDQALVIRRELGLPKEIAYTLANTGIMYAVQHQYDKSFPFMYEAAAIIEEIGDKRGLGRIHHNLGKMNVDSGQHEVAIPHFQKALEIYAELGNDLAYAKTTNTLGRAYRLLGELDLAQTHFERAIAMRREEDDRSGISLSYHNLSLIAGDREDYPLAVQHAEHSLALMTEINLTQQMGGNMAYLSLAYAEAGQPLPALKMALRHYEHIEAFGRDIVPGVTRLAIALALSQEQLLGAEAVGVLERIAVFTGQNGDAATYFQAALAESIATERRLSRLMTLRHWGRWQYAQGQPEAGLPKLREAKEGAEGDRILLELDKLKRVCARLGIDYASL